MSLEGDEAMDLLEPQKRKLLEQIVSSSNHKIEFTLNGCSDGSAILGKLLGEGLCQSNLLMFVQRVETAKQNKRKVSSKRF